MHLERPRDTIETDGDSDPPSFAEGELTGVRVLVVDDDEALAELYARSLLSAGASVHSRSNGRDALEALRNGAFDVLVSDLDMPYLDGLGLVSELRGAERHRALPALALTGSTMPGIRERALEAGFDSFATKPVLADQLIGAVRTLLETKNRT